MMLCSGNDEHSVTFRIMSARFACWNRFERNKIHNVEMNKKNQFPELHAIFNLHCLSVKNGGTKYNFIKNNNSYNNGSYSASNV